MGSYLKCMLLCSLFSGLTTLFKAFGYCQVQRCDSTWHMTSTKEFKPECRTPDGAQRLTGCKCYSQATHYCRILQLP